MPQVFLSATLSNASEFAHWVAHLHKQPCHVVYTDYRCELFVGLKMGCWVFRHRREEEKDKNQHLHQQPCRVYRLQARLICRLAGWLLGSQTTGEACV